MAVNIAPINIIRLLLIIIGSMNRLGNCWDNAISESFFHTLKVELVHQNNYLTRDEAKSSIFQYIEAYYN